MNRPTRAERPRRRPMGSVRGRAAAARSGPWPGPPERKDPAVLEGRGVLVCGLDTPAGLTASARASTSFTAREARPPATRATATTAGRAGGRRSARCRTTPPGTGRNGTWMPTPTRPRSARSRRTPATSPSPSRSRLRRRRDSRPWRRERARPSRRSSQGSSRRFDAEIRDYDGNVSS